MWKKCPFLRIYVAEMAISAEEMAINVAEIKVIDRYKRKDHEKTPAHYSSDESSETLLVFVGQLFEIVD